MMVSLVIEAHGPLAFAFRRPGTQFRQSLPYVPGGAIFAALAASGYVVDDFVELRCHNAYPALAGDGWVRPLPATAHVPKRDGSPRDTLVPRLTWEQQAPRAFVYAESDSAGRSLIDAAKWPFYTLREGTLLERTVAQRVLTRVAINRERGTAEDGRLYSPLVLSEVSTWLPEQLGATHSPDDAAPVRRQTMFRGSVRVPDGNEAILARLGAITQLGGRQSSGLGVVSVQVEPLAQETGSELAARIERLTRQFQRQAALTEALGGTRWNIPDRSIFTINLLSDTILYEQGWLATTTLGGQLLHESAGVEACLIRSFSGHMIVGGWNVSWQRPKSTELATTAGSLFVFQADHSLTDAECDLLARFQHDGIGERRQEGYGQIRICDEFHLLSGDAQ